MTTWHDSSPLSRRRFWLRWSYCLALALALHAVAVAALLKHWRSNIFKVASAPAFVIDLAPLPVAPQIKPTPLSPGPQQAQASRPPQQPPQAFKDDMKIAPEKPVEKTVSVPLPPEPQAELPATAPLPPKPAMKLKDKFELHRHASLASAPSPATHRAPRRAAPASGAFAHDPDAVPNWKSRLIARLERYKRYPAAAQAQGDEGVAQLAFSVDRAGRVHHARILHSSGSRLLDRATLALVEHAQPLPPPPPEMRSARIAIVVPIRYSLR